MAVKGTKPYPGAFTFADGKKVIVWRATHLGAWPAWPGCIIPTADAGIAVGCGDGCALRLDSIEIDGRIGNAREFPEFSNEDIQLGGP